MSPRIVSKKKLIPTYIFPFMLAIIFCCNASSEERPEWKELITRHTIIRYYSYDDLKKFDKKIDYFHNSSFSGLKILFSSPSKMDEFEKRIQDKVDGIFMRVQEILGMRKAMDRVKINIYHNGRDLKKAYYDLYNKEGNLRSWYIYENNTIYLNARDMHEGVLAHEFAHSIIDHYLTVRPPAASSEILARYVDRHLME